VYVNRQCAMYSAENSELFDFMKVAWWYKRCCVETRVTTRGTRAVPGIVLIDVMYVRKDGENKLEFVENIHWFAGGNTNE
jgi:hypothetical protein